MSSTSHVWIAKICLHINETTQCLIFETVQNTVPVSDLSDSGNQTPTDSHHSADSQIRQRTLTMPYMVKFETD